MVRPLEDIHQARWNPNLYYGYGYHHHYGNHHRHHGYYRY